MVIDSLPSIIMVSWIKMATLLPATCLSVQSLGEY